MEINEAHFLGWSDNPKPVKKIAYRPTKETTTRVLALINGSLDCTDGNLPADQVDQINKSKIAFVQKDVVMKTFVIRMNNTKPPFDNINARKAFATPSTTWASSTTSWVATPRATPIPCRKISGASPRMRKATTTTSRRPRSTWTRPWPRARR